ncbi:MAG: TIGR04076 family protein [Gammaproteobacteria bacterium]|nr:TIGR04076 family protein [Gammaproteobacteria bacterium]
MPFQVRATVVAMLGDAQRYPCHFQHQLGEEFIYDGERFSGRLCPSIASLVIPQMMAVHAAGPRHISRPALYYPFWYAPLSVDAPELKKFDGLGFRNVLAAPDLDHPPNRLMPPRAFDWPAHDCRDISKAPAVTCPDVRTAVTFRIEAFDLSERGYDVPYFRRAMMILHKLLAQPGLPVASLIEAFTAAEQLDIYPALSPVLIEALREELELMQYLELRAGRAFVTARGQARFERFRAELPLADRQALGL